VNFAFAGTPDFAAWTLEHLASLGRRPCLVISQPDRPVGRGRRATAPPAAVAAQRLGLEIVQPANINDPDLLERLHACRAEALVVAAFGQMLKRDLLGSLSCLNVHGSLLPAYRGAAPIERALAAGETRTGVSIMLMAEGLDSGPWALQTSVSVSLRDDAGSLARVLAVIGALGVDQVLTGLEDGTVAWTEQEGEPTYAPKLNASDGLLDLTRPARAVHDQVRALSPRVGARAKSGDLTFKLWRTWPYGQPGLDEAPQEAERAAGRSGETVIAGERLFVGCGQGVVQLLSVQPDGKSVMGAAAFLRGYKGRLGDRVDPADDGSPATRHSSGAAGAGD
jgi:methionyl-tRNA formyltransferase